jgi:DNA-binding protein H-NS
MPTLDELQKQIADLQAQADQMKLEKRADILEQVRRDIQAYELTAEECGFANASGRGKGRKASKGAKSRKVRESAASGSSTSGRGSKPPRSSKTPRARKSPSQATGGYRGPNGEQWAGGKGPRPKWVKEILASGGSLEDYKA